MACRAFAPIHYTMSTPAPVRAEIVAHNAAWTCLCGTPEEQAACAEEAPTAD